MPDSKKDDINQTAENKAQTAFPTKKEIDKKKNTAAEPPVATTVTDAIKNSALQTPGLNQQEVNNDLLPLE